jgi:peptide/nickel transport system substrate-binding protein
MRLCRAALALAVLAPWLAAGPVAAERALLVLSEGVPASLDVDGPAGNHDPSQTGFLNIIEPLVDYVVGGANEDGVQLYDFTRFAPRLAESWHYDPGTLTWTLALRRDVKGCNGATFDADDVLYSFARAKSLSGVAPVGWFLGNVASIDGFTKALLQNTQDARAARELGDEIQKLDAYTVTIRQSAPNKLFLPALTIYGLGIYDKQTMQAHATPADPWSHNYAGSVNAPSFGPWCVERWRKEEVFTVKANPDYYRGTPYFDRVIMRAVPQSANRVGILRTGKAQFVEGLSPKEYAFLERTSGIKVSGAYLNGSLILLANWKSPPLDDPRVREALAYATPYQDLVRGAYFGAAKQWHGLIPSEYPGYVRPAATYRYEPERARALLAAAGYPNGRGLEQFADAFKLSYALDRENTLGPVATQLRTALRRVGFPVQLDPLPAVQLADRQLVKKDLPLSLYDGLTPIGVDVAYALLLSFITPPAGLNNMTNFSDPVVDEMFDKALIEPDPALRQEYLATAQEVLARRLAFLPLAEFEIRWATAPDLEGLTLHPTQSVPWYPLRLSQGAP